MNRTHHTVHSEPTVRTVPTAHTESSTTPAPGSHNQALGALGESIAAEYLSSLGYRIIARNWRIREGELDIIAQHGSTFVAVEVKTRSGLGYGHPLEAVTVLKARRLRKLLQAWARDKQMRSPKLRIDAIGITVRAGAQPRIDHVLGILA